jgi:HAE1 family hydrophobic/amphiphilic exporter-1
MRDRLLASALTVSVAFVSFAMPADAQQPAFTVAPAAAPVPTATPLPVPGLASPPPSVLPAIPQVAPGYAAPSNAPLPNGNLVGIQQQPFVGIKLDDAIAMALQRNTNLAIDESNLRIANYQIVAAKGAYDVNFELQPEYQHEVDPAESPFSTGPDGGPVTQISTGAKAGFTGQTPFGTQYSLTGSMMATNNNTIYNSYNPFYQTAIALNVTQPLLRGTGGGDPRRRQLILATQQAVTQQDAILTDASQTITNVADTYWDLVSAWRNVGIQEEGLRNAAAQAASTRRQAQRGYSAPIDVVQSTTQINVFQDNIFSALQQVQSLQNQLKSEILANPADPLWTANLVPTSAVLELPPEPTVDELIMSALKNRPEIAQLRAQRLIANANLAYYKNQELPQIDLNAGITANGFAGVPTNLSGTPLFQTLVNETNSLNSLVNAYNTTVPAADQIPTIVDNFGTTPAYQTGKYGQSWTNALDFRFPTYTISLTIHFPLQNRTAKADYGIAQEQARQIAVQELSLLQRVRAEATNAIQALREARYRLASATAAREAAQQVLASEERLYNAGTSTTFLVLQRQITLANTEGQELSAQTDLNKAVAQLNQVAGTNFAQYNIQVDSLGGNTLGTVTPTTEVLPLPADAQVSPQPPRR